MLVLQQLLYSIFPGLKKFALHLQFKVKSSVTLQSLSPKALRFLFFF